jgi:hypothetical protein
LVFLEISFDIFSSRIEKVIGNNFLPHVVNPLLGVPLRDFKNNNDTNIDNIVSNITIILNDFPFILIIYHNIF